MVHPQSKRFLTPIGFFVFATVGALALGTYTMLGGKVSRRIEKVTFPLSVLLTRVQKPKENPFLEWDGQGHGQKPSEKS